MSSPEAATPQTPDGLALLASLYGAEISCDLSIVTAHAIINYVPEPWTRARLAEDCVYDRSMAHRATDALKGLSMVERINRGRPASFAATELMVASAFDLNRIYGALIDEVTVNTSTPIAYSKAIGLLAIKNRLPAEMRADRILQIVSAAKRQHPATIAYHALQGFARLNACANIVGVMLDWHIKNHPLAQQGYRAARLVARRAQDATRRAA